MFNFLKRRTNLDREWVQLINEKLTLIIYQNKIIMGQNEKLEALTERLNLATNDIAADLKLLKDQIAANAVTDEALAKLDQNIAALEALGASTENPVPEEPTEPTEPTPPTV